MLAIRMQRSGRRGHAQYRVVVQDTRAHPTSGRVVAYLGSYDPHTKKSILKADEINSYIKNGAQPSETMVKLLLKEGFKLPAWTIKPQLKKGAIRNPEKLRRNRPAAESEQHPEAITETSVPPADENPPADEEKEQKPDLSDAMPPPAETTSQTDEQLAQEPSNSAETEEKTN